MTMRGDSASAPPTEGRDLTTWSALVAGGLAITSLAVALGVRFGTASAPFLGEYRLAVDAGTLLAPAVAAVVLVATWRGWLDRLPWPWLLTTGFLGTLAWALALAVVDGGDGLTRPVVDPNEYLADVPAVGDHPGGFLATFVHDAPGHAAATRGHPPGPVLLLWALIRLGVTRPLGIGLLITAIGALTVPLVLGSVRALCDETTARRFAPVLMLAPFAVWTAVSLDAVVSTLDAAMVAAGVMASSPLRRGLPAVAWAALSGLLLGVAALFSYTAPWVALSVVCVYFVRRRAALTLVTGLLALVPVIAAQATGFSWLDGLLAARTDFSLRVQPDRPVLLWAALSVVVLLLACGPALVASARKLRNTPGWPFLVGGSAAVLFALVAGLARGGMEHAWLPFFPWLLVAATAPETPGGTPVPSPILLVAVGALTAVVIQAVLATTW